METPPRYLCTLLHSRHVTIIRPALTRVLEFEVFSIFLQPLHALILSSVGILTRFLRAVLSIAAPADRANSDDGSRSHKLARPSTESEAILVLLGLALRPAPMIMPSCVYQSHYGQMRTLRPWDQHHLSRPISPFLCSKIPGGMSVSGTWKAFGGLCLLCRLSSG